MRRAEWIASGVVSLGLLLGFGFATVCADDKSPRPGKEAGRLQPDQAAVKAVASDHGDAAKSVPSHSAGSERTPSAVGRAAERSGANAAVDRAASARGTAASRTPAAVDRGAAVSRSRDAGRDASVNRSNGDTRITAARTGRITVYEKAKTLPARPETHATLKPGSNGSATDTARAPMPRAPKTLTKGDRETAVASADRDRSVRAGRTDARALDDTKTDATVTREAPTAPDIKLPGAGDKDKAGAARTQAEWHGRAQGDSIARPAVTERKAAGARDASPAASRDGRNHSGGPSERAVRPTVTARAGASGHFESDRDRAQGAKERGRDHSGTTVVASGHTIVSNHATVVRHDNHFRHERFRHHPPVYAPIVCRPSWWDGWYAPASGFGIGWHSRHWSVWIGDWWPVYRSVVVERVYVAAPVIWYEPIYVSAPRVRIVEPYDRIDRLADKLAYGTADERQDAARAFGYEDTLRALEPLVDALQYDTDSMVRYEAARSLGKLGFRDALPALHRAASEDPDEVVRDEAHDSIDAIINY